MLKAGDFMTLIYFIVSAGIIIYNLSYAIYLFQKKNIIQTVTMFVLIGISLALLIKETFI